MEVANMANGLIKILIKIHLGSRSPMPPRFPTSLFTRDPHYPPNQYQKPKIPQIGTRNPKLPKFELRPPLTQLILISQNHDQNKQSLKPNGSKLFNKFQCKEESTNDVLL